jgi:hypothetical protein
MLGASRFKEDPSSSRQGNHLEHTTHTYLFSAETKADEFGANLKKIPLALGWVAIWIYTTQMSIESDSVQNEGRREFGAKSYARRKTYHLILPKSLKFRKDVLYSPEPALRATLDCSNQGPKSLRRAPMYSTCEVRAFNC